MGLGLRRIETKRKPTRTVKPIAMGVNILAMLESKSRTGMFALFVPGPQPLRTLTH